MLDAGCGAGLLALLASLRGARMSALDAAPFVFPNAEVSWRANASAAPNQLAIAHSGEAAECAALGEGRRAQTRPAGSIRYENVFLWVVGEQAWRRGADHAGTVKPDYERPGEIVECTALGARGLFGGRLRGEPLLCCENERPSSEWIAKWSRLGE